MLEATVLVPTHAERPSLEQALRSALEQTVTDIEVVVVGDGCPDSTRTIMQRMMRADARLRFFDNPKGERHGEAHRDAALREARGRIVTYLSDDDLLFSDHVATAKRCLEGATFFVARPVFVSAEGRPYVMDGDITVPAWVTALRTTKRNFIPLTGTAHTLESYRSLPEGWAPAPADIWTDLHMWRKFFVAPDFVGVAAPHPTSLVFPTPLRVDDNPQKRTSELATWERVRTAQDARQGIERVVLAWLQDEASARTLAYESVSGELRAARVRSEADTARLQTQDDELTELRAVVDAGRAREREVTRELEQVRAAHAATQAELELMRQSATWRLRERLYNQAWVRTSVLTVLDKLRR